MGTLAVLTLSGTLALGAVEPQDDPQALFEAGKYAETIAALPADGARSPGQAYLAGQAYLRLEQTSHAREAFEKLVAGDDENAWTFVGRSAIARLSGNSREALETARQATALDGSLAQAHYQLGLAYYDHGQFDRAARTFARAATLEPEMASTHYYAGMAYMRADREDLMAAHFRRFLELAPGAPERPAVESVMRARGT